MFNAKGRRITEMTREAAQRKFGMNMDREADFFLFGRLFFDRRRMKLINAVVRKPVGRLEEVFMPPRPFH